MYLSKKEVNIFTHVLMTCVGLEVVPVMCKSNSTLKKLSGWSEETEDMSTALEFICEFI